MYPYLSMCQQVFYFIDCFRTMGSDEKLEPSKDQYSINKQINKY